MAHKKAGGSTRLGRDSQSKRLGVKVFGDQMATAGAIIIRQTGQKFRAGENVGVGTDFSLYAKTAGKVKFSNKKMVRFTGLLKDTRIVSVEPFKPVAKKESK
ncbi:MAG: 50S ribosomal protein L27 [Patescibacteria group bacterium]